MTRADRFRRHILPAVFILITLLVMFWNLFTLKSAFLSGDHREQQYPWAKFYQSQIRAGHLPWWTTQIHSGFPLLAEGQVSAFYPISFLTFYFLPTKVAYNYGILLHYALGALFLYFYLQHLKLSRTASVISCLIFLYGSTQGGYFYYNYISQKVVIWLPLTLILIERLLSDPRTRDVFFLSLCFAFQIFGGYLQVAVYSLLFSSLYFLLRWIKIRKVKPFVFFAIAGLLGVSFALPQLLPTFELAQLSARANAAKEIAYIGSMSPAGFLTIFYPSWDGLLGSELYIGLLGFFFFLCSFRVRRNHQRSCFLFLAVIFLLLALGEWSPLYRGIIEVTGFHSFRTPIKFLFFVSFSLSVLAGYGFDYFQTRLRNPKPFKTLRFFLFLCAAAGLLPFFARLALEAARPYALPELKKYVTKKFYGQPGHPHELADYEKKAEGFYHSVVETVTLSKNRDTAIEWGLIVCAAGLVVFVFRSRKLGPAHKFTLIGFLLLDLYLYGGTSIRPNLDSFDTIDRPQTNSPIVNHLIHDPSVFRITELYTGAGAVSPFPVSPSTNMLYGLDDLGAYSPLMVKTYKEFIQGWGGYTNDSFSVGEVEKQQLLDRIQSLRLLNVKYILSHEHLSSGSLRLVTQEPGTYLYEISEPFGRAYFYKGSKPPDSIHNLNEKDIYPVQYAKEGEQMAVYDFNAPEKGYLLTSELFYPKWVAVEEGKQINIETWSSVFRALPVSPGRHHIEMHYSPRVYQKLWAVSMAVMLFGSCYFTVEYFLRRRYAA